MSAEEIRAHLLKRFPAARHAGAGVYAVGGAVRDLLMGREPKDLDLVCRDAASQARELASSIGSRVVVLGRGELAVYRIPAGDIEYDLAEMTGNSMAEDLGRRDFTLNALALRIDGSDPLIDPFGGRSDIGNGVVRLVSAENIAGDPLRIIRGARLAAGLGFEVEEETRKTLAALVPGLATVAPERVTAEMEAMLSGRNRGRSAELLRELAIDRVIFGEELSVGVAAALGALEGDHLAAYAVIMLNWPGEKIDGHASRWRWSDAARKGVAAVITLVRGAAEGNPSQLPVLLHAAGRAAAERALEVMRAEGGGTACQTLEELIRRRGAAIFDAAPLLNGEEIASLTALAPGRHLGALRKALLEAQLLGRVTSMEEARQFVTASIGQLDVDVADADRDIQK